MGDVAGQWVSQSAAEEWGRAARTLAARWQGRQRVAQARQEHARRSLRAAHEAGRLPDLDVVRRLSAAVERSTECWHWFRVMWRDNERAETLCLDLEDQHRGVPVELGRDRCPRCYGAPHGTGPCVLP